MFGEISKQKEVPEAHLETLARQHLKVPSGFEVTTGAGSTVEVVLRLVVILFKYRGCKKLPYYLALLRSALYP